MNPDRRSSRYLRWLVVLVSWLLSVAVIWLFILDRATSLPPSWGVAAGVRDTPQALADAAFTVFYIPPTSLLGLLILRRRPGQPIGWLLIWAALLSGLVAFTSELTIWSNFTHPGTTWLAAGAAWLLNVIWILPIAVFCWLLTVFPDGNLPSPRWRWVQGLIVSFALGLGAAVLIESPMHSAFSLPNPVWAEFPGRAELYGLAYGLGVVSLVGTMAGLALLVIQRFRRARGDERQQFKWLALSAISAALLMVLGLVLGVGFGQVAGQVLVNYASAFFPVGIGVAVLRYRLYDVDLVIRRTLVYSILTALLALVYFGLVLILQNSFSLISGQESPVALVVSTLAIAALFFPLRSRVQAFIDRRFYRSKYDAAATLAAFAAAARDETDLAVLTARLAEVVDETMQPDVVNVWLKKAAPNKSDAAGARRDAGNT